MLNDKSHSPATAISKAAQQPDPGQQTLVTLLVTCILILSSCSSDTPGSTAEKVDTREGKTQREASDRPPSTAVIANRPDQPGGGRESESSSDATPGALKIEFDSPDCDFGKEVESYFAKAIAVRERTGNGHEGAINVVPVDRRVGNVRVNFAFVGWESSGLIFDEPVADVRDALAIAGAKFREDWTLDLGPNAQAIGYVAQAEGAFSRFGKSVLSCGV
jgi:hypothetical protein